MPSSALNDPSSADDRRNYRLRHGEARSRILSACRALACDRPLGEISIDDVAQVAGVSRRTIYNQFVSRIALCRASQEEPVDEYAAALPREIEMKSGARQGLLDYVEQIARAQALPGHSELLLALAQESADPWLKTIYRERVWRPIVQTIQLHLLREWRAKVEILEVLQGAEGLVEAIHGLRLARRITGGADDDLAQLHNLALAWIERLVCTVQ